MIDNAVGNVNFEDVTAIWFWKIYNLTNICMLPRAVVLEHPCS